MGKENEKQRIVPLRGGLFTIESDKFLLLGNRCEICDQLFFPSRPFCFTCFSDRMETVKLGGKGKLYSFTTSYMPSLHFKPPYTVGWIELLEGIRIFSPIIKREEQNLEIGMEVELVVEELWVEENKSIIGYKFRPIDG
jgi:uncharacterized OB-fold protein